MEWKLLLENLRRSFALIMHTQTWLAGGVLTVIASAARRMLIVQEGSPLEHAPLAPLFALSLAIVFIVVTFAVLPILARSLAHDEVGQVQAFEWPEALLWLLLCGGLSLASEFAVAYADAMRWLPDVPAWGRDAVLRSALGVTLLAPMVQLVCVGCGWMEVGFVHVVRRLAAHFSWFGGFFILFLSALLVGSVLTQAVLKLYAFLEITVATPALLIAAVLKGVTSLIMFLYAIHAARIIAAGVAEDPGEVFI